MSSDDAEPSVAMSYSQSSNPPIIPLKNPSPTPETAHNPQMAVEATAAGSPTSTRHDRDQATDGTKHDASSQQQLSDYRARLARDLERRELHARGMLPSSADKHRFSPIPEESTSSAQWPSSNLNTSSTDSGHTIRGPFTPASVRTPSYPFPRMNSGMVADGAAARFAHHLHSTSPNTSPQIAIATSTESRFAFERVDSELSTPASAFGFPSRVTPHHEPPQDGLPDLYQLSLLLTAEPGLEAWWNTVVQIMRDVYDAERVTLSIPADSTDIENVPWGQKATYNQHEADDLSMAYLTKGSSAKQNSETDISDTFASPDEFPAPEQPARPGLVSRHSFTTYEEKKKSKLERPSTLARRPTQVGRSDVSYPLTPATELPPSLLRLDKTTLEEHEAEDDAEANIPSWEMPFRARYDGQGRILPVLQALNYEADPLIDHVGVMRVLERGRPVALTRTYPYLPRAQQPGDVSETGSVPKKASSDTSKTTGIQRSESASKLSDLLTANRAKSQTSEKLRGSTNGEDGARPSTPRYEEYEQAPPSPWSQSPAPSPAVRPDSQENPFFTDAMVDEDSFNPGATTQSDYADMKPLEAIGLENSWTVLHIPLNHILLSKQSRLLKGGAASILQQQKQPKPTPDGCKAKKAAPIAILSILSPTTPYPAGLRRSLEQLAPHMATSFSLCRHFTNLETELAGMQRRRPNTTGFGAVAPYDPSLLNIADPSQLQSLAGSITSPSDFSAISKSATGSPIGTPGWETTYGSLSERRQPLASPAAGSQSGGGYFSSKHYSSSRHGGLTPGHLRPRADSKDASPGEKRHPRPSSALDTTDEANTGSTPFEDPASSFKDVRAPSRSGTDSNTDELPVMFMDRISDSPKIGRSQSLHQPNHSMLHSYGADFASTFQSLPPSSTLRSRPAPVPLTSTPTRSMSVASAVVDLPPPSDRLKGLILDSLPAHVFVALPQTGEIVWVNSRYLAYRGQSVSDLAADPWLSFHPDDRDDYLKDWGHSLRTGEQFSRTIRIRRFDGAYRWFYARAVASRDKRGVIMQFLGSYMDIHDQHIAELKAARQEEIEASETKHRLLANLIPQIIFTATEEEGITFANEQWLSYTGQSFDDCLGLGFMDYVHPDDLAKCRIPTGRRSSKMTSNNTHSQASSEKKNVRFGSQKAPKFELPEADLAALAKKGIVRISKDSNGRFSYTSEVRLRSKSGEYRWHLIRCVEIDGIDFGRGASSYFGSATDINDLKLMESKLKEAMESKGRFLSNMSHEIRTPLIGISGMVSFLQETVLDEEQRDYANTIQTSANSLIMIINDILDLSKADAGMMKLKYEWFHTRSLIEDVNELVSTMSISKGLELNYLVEADVPAWVKGDKVRIRQVLLNVIGNAIKFTDAGEVFSHCKVVSTEQDHADKHSIMLEFSITDTGRGFSQKEAELIFKPFSQIDGSSTRQHGGSGLGLVISRQLVELHGGTMTGKAVVGKGSTFTFTAMFTLPTSVDQPNLPQSPSSTISVLSRRESSDGIRLSPQLHVGKRVSDAISPSDVQTPTFPPSSSPLNTNVKTAANAQRPLLTGPKASVNGVKSGLTQFSEAAKASGQDLSQMKLEMPLAKDSSGRKSTPEQPSQFVPSVAPPVIYSILIVCPQRHSRDATVQHIEMTLSKDIPHQITAIGTIDEAHDLIGGDDSVSFSHIVINLGSAEAIISLMDEITQHQRMDKTIILILSDSVQRQAVLKVAAGTKYERLLSDNAVTFIYKPVKPSRFAVIFDPDRVRDLSTDLNRSSAQQMLENQKASSQELLRRMGNRGLRVLVVEDNKINQKVLTKYLEKIGVDVDIAEDGIECIETMLSRPHEYYSLILVCSYMTIHHIHTWLTFETSVISKCPEKTALRRARIFASGSGPLVCLASPLSHYPPT